MIQEINDAVKAMFKHPEDDCAVCTECTTELFELLTFRINDDSIDADDLDDEIYNILYRYKNYIAEFNWTYIGMKSFSSAGLPYKFLWDLFISEKQKHS